MRCRVVSKETITIPEKSRMFIPVTVQNKEHLSKWGLIDAGKNPKPDDKVYLTRGIVDPHDENVKIQLVNLGNTPVTVNAKRNLGICETYFDQDQSTIAHCYRIR